MFRRTLLSLFVLGLLAAWTGTAGAAIIPIPASAAVGPPGAGIMPGLTGQYFNLGPFGSTAAARAAAAASVPTGSFVSTLVDYPRGPANDISSGFSVNTLLAPDGPVTGGGNAITTSVFVFSGFIEILPAFDTTPATPTIDVNFSIGSDDGARLQIGGITVFDFSPPRPFFFGDDMGNLFNTASFAAPGVYPIEVVYYENFGFTGIELVSSIPGPSAGPGTPAATPFLVPTGVLFQQVIPEPSSLLLFGVGLAALVGFGRRRYCPTSNRSP